MTEPVEPVHVHEIRSSYDTVAADYAELLVGELGRKPLDRSMLAAFAEMVTAQGGGPVAGLGCGPGRVTTHLHALGGLDAFGVDLSPGMVAEARRRHPELRFEVGSMTALDLEDESLAGVLAWYSTVHTPPEELPVVFAEVHRMPAPGGLVLLAFKVGDGRVRLEHAYGHDLTLDVYRRPPDRVAGLLGEAGFAEVARLVREPADCTDNTPQAFLLARKPTLPPV